MSDITVERHILSALVQNDTFVRKAIAFLLPSYFHEEAEKVVLHHIHEFIQLYSTAPNEADLIVLLRNDAKIDDETTEEAIEVVKDIYDIRPSKNVEFLLKTAQDFCTDKAVFNAIQEAIQIYKGETKKSVLAIPDLLKAALAVNFDSSIGQDYINDAEKRWDYYTNPESKIAFDIQAFNENTNGGIPRKTLNVIIAGVNVGKSLCLVNLACMYVKAGFNVLYISNEMREEAIFNRADANIMNVPLNEIVDLGKERFMSRIDRLREKSHGQFRVKEFPPGVATASHIKNVIDELRIKKNFVPDIVISDYMQIMASARARGEENSYQKYKYVAEEFRALMVEMDMIGWTAAQFNRTGMTSTDPEMTDIGESTGIAATVDGMWAVIRTDELDEIGQLMIKELKSRYGSKARKKFCVGVNIDTQSLYDVNEDQQEKVLKHEVKSSTGGNATRKRFESLKHDTTEDD